MFTIENIKHTQFNKVKALIHTTIQSCYPSIYPKEVVQFFIEYHSLDEIQRRAKEGLVVVLEKYGELLGTGFLSGDELGGVYVTPDHQQKGFGTCIVRHLITHANYLGLERIWLDATPLAKPMYLKLGFTIVSPMIQMVGSVPLNYFKMEMRFSP